MPLIPIVNTSSTPADDVVQAMNMNISTSVPELYPEKNVAASKDVFNSQQLASNYTPLFINGLAVIGWPYYQSFFPENSNFTLKYKLEENRSYVGFLFGDYLEKQVDLDIWLMFFNTTTSEHTLLTFTTTHELGTQDILRFTVTESGNYSIVIYNHVSIEEFSFIGFVLLEDVTNDSNTTFSIDEPKTLPLEVIPQYHTYYGLFIPWKKEYQDVNITITIESPDKPMTINASIFPVLKTTDLLKYDPFLPETLQHSADSKTISTSSSRNAVSTILGPQEEGWMQLPGIILFIQGIEGTGILSLSISTRQQFDIRYTTPLGVPQYFILNKTSNYFAISYYLEATIIYDAFSWIITPADQTLMEKVKIQLWAGSPLDAITNFRNPQKVPLISKESNSATKHVEHFKPESSGRYTFIVYLDTNDMKNLSTPLTVVFNMFERWNLKQSTNKEFFIVSRSKQNPSAYTLQSFKTFFIPIQKWNGKNVTFRITIPKSLEIEAQLAPFTTMSDQLAFSPFSHESAITWKKGLNDQLTLFSEVGRRNKDKVNDTFWVLSVIGIAGFGTVRISWTQSSVPINWVDLTITGTILVACLVVIIVVAWKGEKYLYSF